MYLRVGVFMDQKEKTRKEEPNAAELNSVEGNTTAKASAEERSHLTFRRGLRDGLPICLGYLSVAFTFGMVVVEGGLPPWVAVLISMTCFTGTGQFARIQSADCVRRHVCRNAGYNVYY